MIFIETKNDDRYNISINSFRSWIVKHSDDTEKLERLLGWNKSGNLDLCLDCDK